MKTIVRHNPEKRFFIKFERKWNRALKMVMTKKQLHTKFVTIDYVDAKQKIKLK